MGALLSLFLLSSFPFLSALVLAALDGRCVSSSFELTVPLPVALLAWAEVPGSVGWAGGSPVCVLLAGGVLSSSRILGLVFGAVGWSFGVCAGRRIAV